MLTLTTAAAVYTVLLGDIAHASERPPPLTTRIAEATVATWRCQDQRAVPRTPQQHSPWEHHSRAFRAQQLNLWTTNLRRCLTRLHARDDALRTGRLEQLTTRDLYAAADNEVRRGGIYSTRWGDASPLLKTLCYEAINRAFGGNAGWARYIVNRESGCNPGAVNTTYASWSQRAQCIAQMIPAYHRWVNYPRCLRDLRYAIQVFVRLSRGGTSTGPWGSY